MSKFEDRNSFVSKIPYFSKKLRENLSLCQHNWIRKLFLFREFFKIALTFFSTPSWLRNNSKLAISLFRRLMPLQLGQTLIRPNRTITDPHFGQGIIYVLIA
jgi:hypothetical protein